MSDNTILAYTKDVRAFLAASDNYVSRADFSSCATHWLSVSRRTLAPSTVNRRLSSLRAFAEWAQVSSDLAKYRGPKQTKARPHPLPEGLRGVLMMLRASNNLEHRALIALGGLCGLRISEARSIRASSIDCTERTLKVKGKGEKIRYVPISDMAWDVLIKSYCKSVLNNDAPFVTIGDRSARRTVTSLGRRARLLRRVASHDLRATFATDLLKKGVNIRIIQELLGHSSVAITEAYLGITEDEKRQAVNL